MRLAGKTAVITGGNSGIGLAAATMMVAEGAQVLLVGRDLTKLEAAAGSLGVQASFYQGDMNDSAALEGLAAAVADNFERLDIVFANAGVSGATRLGSTPFTVFDNILRTNLTATFFTLQALVPQMSEGGSIILNGSIQRQMGSIGTTAYAASKAGVSAMAGVLAAELAVAGIRVNTVVPGATRTPIWTTGPRQGKSMEEAEAIWTPLTPIGRLCEPEEIAAAVVFLASDESSGMTGAELIIDGGVSGARGGAPFLRPPPRPEA